LNSDTLNTANMPKVEWSLVVAESYGDDVELHKRNAKHILPIPPEKFRLQSSTGDLGLYYAIGEAWAHLALPYLPPASTVLDIGCSRGRLARFLCIDRTLKYIGFDVHADSITWANEYFPAFTGERAKFVHANLESQVFNAASIKGDKISEYRFPTEDNSIDMAVASSLFTHLYEPDCVHYLHETARVLKSGGTAMYSIHIDVPQGVNYMGEPERVDIDPHYFLKLAQDAGLEPIEIIGNVYGQHLIRLVKR
jgi:ubiquinone/menaquinone biosynthesis C-methylase UbiE